MFAESLCLIGGLAQMPQIQPCMHVQMHLGDEKAATKYAHCLVADAWVYFQVLESSSSGLV